MVETEKKLRPPVFKKKGKEKSASARLRERVKELLAESIHFQDACLLRDEKIKDLINARDKFAIKHEQLEIEVRRLKSNLDDAEARLANRDREITLGNGRIEGLKAALEMMLDHSS